MIKFDFNEYLNYFLNKKINFCESIDLNIVYINKKNIILNQQIELIHSINEYKKFLFLSEENNIFNNIYYGKLYLEKYLKKEIFFEKIFFNKKYFFLIKKYNLQKKFGKKFIVEDYKNLLNKINSKKIFINISKKNFLNLTIGNIKFNKNMIKENYYCVINNIKKIFIKKNILIKKINISTTMGKNFVLK